MFGPNKNRGFQSSLRRLSGQRRAGLARNKRRLGLEQLDPRLMLATSVEAVLLDFEFDGQVLTDTVADYEDEIYKQLLYTVGQLNGDNSVGRIGEVELSEIVVEEATLISDDTDGYRISYHARFPVAWGQPREVPTEYTFKVPSEVTWLGNMYFVGMHYDSCVWEYTAGLAPDTYYWYYRANAEGCELVPELTREMTAVVTPGGQTTTGTYPEMHKIWEDGTLQVVAVFGAYSKGRIAHDLSQGLATDDAGIVAYDDFITAMYDNFGSNGMITDPPNVDAWTDANQVRFSFTFDGRPVVVDAFLVDSLETAGDTFQERYDSLSKRADLIVYNGHAGYGDAIRQFGQMGDWTPGQYAVVFMNACDTYAYGDGAIEKAHAAANVDDSTGSKHVDTIYNVMPSDFGASTFATMTLINGLVDYSAPKSYDTMLEEIYRHIDGNDEIYGQQVPIVVGDEDNVFFPGRDLFTLFETGSVDPGGQDAYSIGDLAAGEYDFYLSATGDNNMVVVAGSTTIPCDPTTDDFSKHCHLELDESAAVSVVVRGNEAMDYEVRGSGCYGSCTPPGAGLIELAAGDANGDFQFDQQDIVQVLQAAKYLTSEPATFEEGDWNGDGVFDQLDIVAALQTGNYLQGPYAARAADAAFAALGS